MTNITMLERFKCAGMLMLRGVAAPLTLPFKFASDGYDGIRQGSWRTFDTLSGFKCSAGAALAGLFCGLVVGTAVLVNAVVEAPYQLVRSSPPQSHPWLLRTFDL